MQLAGTHCGICRHKILVETEATWCARCSTVLHHSCLGDAGGTCPSCQRPHDPPEAHFVFAEQCPECFHRTPTPQARCAACGARMRWDNSAAHAEFMDGMKDAARVCLLRSAIKLAGAAVLLAGFFGVMLVFTPPPALTLAGILSGFLALTLGGVGDLRQGCRIAAFRGRFPNPPPPGRAPG